MSDMSDRALDRGEPSPELYELLARLVAPERTDPVVVVERLVALTERWTLHRSGGWCLIIAFWGLDCRFLGVGFVGLARGTIKT